MDPIDDYTNDSEHVDDLDMDMVADFGDSMGVDIAFDHHDQVKDALELKSTVAAPAAAYMQGNPAAAGHLNNVDVMFQTETGIDGSDDDEDSSPPMTKRRRETQDVPGGFTFVDKDGGDSGRRKIRIEYITDKSRRHITFSKRKAGIMKKAYELSILTGTQVLLLVVSETGLVYTFTTTKFQPLVTQPEGKGLIQGCLNAKDGFAPNGQPINGSVVPSKGKNGGLSIRPHKLTAAVTAAMAATAAQAAGATPDEAHAAAQAEAAASLGQGLPPNERPKKRLPSGKRRTASQSQLPTNQQQQVQTLPEQQQQHQHQGQQLQSPLSNSYHMPDFHHHQQHAVHSPTAYGYPQPQQNDYVNASAYYPIQPAPGHPGHPGHAGFMVHPGMYQQQPPPPPQTQQQQQQQQQQQGGDRRMMTGDPNMRMGM